MTCSPFLSTCPQWSFKSSDSGVAMVSVCVCVCVCVTSMSTDFTQGFLTPRLSKKGLWHLKCSKVVFFGHYANIFRNSWHGFYLLRKALQQRILAQIQQPHGSCRIARKCVANPRAAELASVSPKTRLERLQL